MIHIYKTKWSNEYYAVDTLYGPHIAIYGYEHGYKKSLKEAREMVAMYIKNQRPEYIETILVPSWEILEE